MWAMRQEMAQTAHAMAKFPGDVPIIVERGRMTAPIS